ncbi:MAG: shikimate dehydrogenase [Bacteroidota bacterium]|nr:shikimate dehydrogenase [Bacteroidota bacterium]
MILYGLIGEKLGHSFSQKYFSEKFRRLALSENYYKNFEISSIEEFPKLIAGNPEIAGLNVTIPYKQKIIPFLDIISDAALQIGAVNTISIKRTEKGIILKGDNTDIIGFEKTLLSFLVRDSKPQQKTPQAIVLGTGGAAKAVSFVLTKLNIPHIFVSRKPSKKDEINYSQLNKKIIDNYHLIINTTPIGMYPDINRCPEIPFHYIGKHHFLYDLIYNPAETDFLRRGRLQEAKTINGQLMLEIQAEESWKIWNKEN